MKGNKLDKNRSENEKIKAIIKDLQEWKESWIRRDGSKSTQFEDGQAAGLDYAISTCKAFLK